MKHILLVVFVMILLSLPTISYAECGTGYGDVLDSFQNIPAKSNGEYNNCTWTGNGDWQCVEYVKRFYEDEVGDAITTSWGYAANAYENNDPGLSTYANGGTMAPEVGDILCFDDGDDGHVGIVTNVNHDQVKIIDQNRTTSSSEIIMALSMSDANDHYTVSDWGDYDIEGWLRDPDYKPDYAYTAAFISKSPSDPVLYLQPDENFNCSINFRNTGKSFWSDNGDISHYIELQSVDAEWDDGYGTNPLLSPSRVKLAETGGVVDSNSTVAFQFTIHTPSTPGSYSIRVRLYHPHSESFISGTGPGMTFNVEVVDEGELVTATPTPYDVTSHHTCISNIYEDPTYCVANGYTANKLVDGNTSTLAYPAATQVDYEISLDGYDYVKTVTIRFGVYGTNSVYISSWQIQCLDPAGNWITKSSGGFPNTSQLTLNINMATTKLRVKASSSNWIGLYEVTAEGFKNFARALTVTTDDGNPPYEHDPDNMTDGSFSTKAYPGASSYTYEIMFPEIMDVYSVSLVGKEFTKNNPTSYITNWSLKGYNGVSWVTFASGSNPSTNFVAKIAANKRMSGLQIICSGPNWSGIYETGIYGNLSEPGSSYDAIAYTGLTGRFNSDTKTDIGYYRRLNGGWPVSISDGAEFDNGGTWRINFGPDYGSQNWQPLVGDFNGDDKDDILIFTPLTGNWQVSISDGAEFDGDGTWRNNCGVDDGSQNWRGLTGDFNGDGKDDICAYSPRDGKWIVSISDGAEFDGDGTWASNFGSGGGLPKAVSNELPYSFQLFQNYPNPFNPNTTICYSLPEVSLVNLTIYNILGKRVATLINEYQQPGEHQVVWNSQNRATGMYFYRLVAGDVTETKKMVLVK